MTLPYTDQINAMLDTLADDPSFDVNEKLRVFEASEVLSVVVKRLLDLEAAGGVSYLLLASVTLEAADVATWETVGAQLLAPTGAGHLARAVSAWATVHATGSPYDQSAADIYLADDAAFNNGASYLVVPVASGLDSGSLFNALWMSRVPTIDDPVSEGTNTVPAGGGGLYVFGSANLTGGANTVTVSALYTVIDVT